MMFYSLVQCLAFNVFSKNYLFKVNGGNSLVVRWLGGEGNGNPLQYPCQENPVDRGAWWAAVHGVAQSQT